MLTVIADRGYFKGEEILAYEQADATPLVLKPLTSDAKAEGRFGKQDFVYIPEDDVYRCPAGELLTWRFDRVEDGQLLRHYWTTARQGYAIKAQRTTGTERRIKRWEHESVIECIRTDNATNAVTGSPIPSVSLLGSLGDHAVPGGIEDAAAVRRDQPVDDSPASLQPGERGNLVVRHQPAVASYVGGEDRSKFALYRLDGHIWLLPRTRCANLRSLARLATVADGRFEARTRC